MQGAGQHRFMGRMWELWKTRVFWGVGDGKRVDWPAKDMGILNARIFLHWALKKKRRKAKDTENKKPFDVRWRGRIRGRGAEKSCYKGKQRKEGTQAPVRLHLRLERLVFPRLCCDHNAVKSILGQATALRTFENYWGEVATSNFLLFSNNSVISLFCTIKLCCFCS